MTEDQFKEAIKELLEQMYEGGLGLYEIEDLIDEAIKEWESEIFE